MLWLVVRAFAFRTMRAIRLVAFGVEVERVFLDHEAAFARNALLAAFNLFVDELLDPAAIDADKMVVVLPGLHLEHGFAGFALCGSYRGVDGR